MTTSPPSPGSDAWLANVSEVERVGGWSLRSALVRYAQAEPERAGAVLEVVRRLDAALAPHRSRLDHAGARPAVDGLDALLEAARRLDQLADTVAVWANDRSAGARPDAAVDKAVAGLQDELDRLGVAREVRDPAEWARLRRQA